MFQCGDVSGLNTPWSEGRQMATDGAITYALAEPIARPDRG